MLDVDQLTVAITGVQSRTILHEVSYSVAAGESLGLVGESGSGKSMSLRAILRILPEGAKTQGAIRFFDENIGEFSSKRLREFRSQEVALIAQNPHGVLNPVYRVEDFLLEGPVLLGGENRKDARIRVASLLEQVGIHDVERVLRSFPHQLSGGMLQRVVIAAAIAAQPKLLLADEPTTALDVTTQAEVVAILDEMRRERGMGMVFVTHDLDLAAAICDRIAVMQNGKIVEIGDVDAIYHHAKETYTQKLLASRPQHLENFTETAANEI